MVRPTFLGALFFRLAERLLEGERVWALLRSAYLAGAASGDNCPCSGARDVADGDEKEAEQGKKEGRWVFQ